MTGAIGLMINGQEVRVDEGVTLLQAIRQAGISIPTLCYHPYLKPVGSCRLCVVDVEGDRGNGGGSVGADAGQRAQAVLPAIAAGGLRIREDVQL